jgi:glucose-6-phosphate-specific signal transduction histidine kinase
MLEIRPNMINTLGLRKVLRQVMEKLNIEYKAVPIAYYLTVEISEEDALIFELVNGGQLVWNTYLLS